MRLENIDGLDCSLLKTEDEIRRSAESIARVRARLEVETPDTEPLRYLARITANPGYEAPRIAICEKPGFEFLVAGFVRANSGPIKTRTLKFLLNGLIWKNAAAAEAAGKCVALLLKSDGCTDAYTQLYPLKNSEAFFAASKQRGLLVNFWNRQTQRLATLYAEGRDHPRDQISSKRRLRIRKNERLIESMTGGPIRIETITRTDQVDEFMAATHAIFPHTWQSEKGLGVRDIPVWRGTVQLEAEAGRLYSHVLYGNGIPIAYQFGTLYGNTFNYEVMGFNQDYGKASPGQLLRIEMLSQLFERKIVGFEMGAGDLGFKRSWSDHSVEIANFQLCRKTPLGYGKFLTREAKTLTKGALSRFKRSSEEEDDSKTNT